MHAGDRRAPPRHGDAPRPPLRRAPGSDSGRRQQRGGGCCRRPGCRRQRCARRRTGRTTRAPRCGVGWSTGCRRRRRTPPGTRRRRRQSRRAGSHRCRRTSGRTTRDPNRTPPGCSRTCGCRAMSRRAVRTPPDPGGRGVGAESRGPRRQYATSDPLCQHNHVTDAAGSSAARVVVGPAGHGSGTLDQRPSGSAGVHVQPRSDSARRAADHTRRPTRRRPRAGACARSAVGADRRAAQRSRSRRCRWARRPHGRSRHGCRTARRHLRAPPRRGPSRPWRWRRRTCRESATSRRRLPGTGCTGGVRGAPGRGAGRRASQTVVAAPNRKSVWPWVVGRARADRSAESSGGWCRAPTTTTTRSRRRPRRRWSSSTTPRSSSTPASTRCSTRHEPAGRTRRRASSRRSTRSSRLERERTAAELQDQVDLLSIAQEQSAAAVADLEEQVTTLEGSLAEVTAERDELKAQADSGAMTDTEFLARLQEKEDEISTLEDQLATATTQATRCAGGLAEGDRRSSRRADGPAAGQGVTRGARRAADRELRRQRHRPDPQ